MIHDTAVIGAGICGCATAYFLTKEGQKVALIDREGIAAGGSGAAGAFISPKISRGGPLKALMEEAYRYSLSFYEDNFPDLIRIAPLLHIAKREDENDKVAALRSGRATRGFSLTFEMSKQAPHLRFLIGLRSLVMRLALTAVVTWPEWIPISNLSGMNSRQ